MMSGREDKLYVLYSVWDAGRLNVLHSGQVLRIHQLESGNHVIHRTLKKNQFVPLFSFMCG